MMGRGGCGVWRIRSFFVIYFVSSFHCDSCLFYVVPIGSNCIIIFHWFLTYIDFYYSSSNSFLQNRCDEGSYSAEVIVGRRRLMEMVSDGERNVDFGGKNRIRAVGMWVWTRKYFLFLCVTTVVRGDGRWRWGFGDLKNNVSLDSLISKQKASKREIDWLFHSKQKSKLGCGTCSLNNNSHWKKHW